MKHLENFDEIAFLKSEVYRNRTAKLNIFESQMLRLGELLGDEKYFELLNEMMSYQYTHNILINETKKNLN